MIEKANAVRSFFNKNRNSVLLLSGGVDSSVLALLAAQGSDGSVRTLTFRTLLVNEEEIEAAEKLSAHLGLRHTVMDVDISDCGEVKDNGPDRCYWCRKTLQRHALSWARKNGCSIVADGVQADETSERRPGLRAADEDGIRHPLAEAGLSKDEIRTIAREAQLPCAEKPPAPCMATRFPTGIPLQFKWIGRLQEAETILASMGFSNFRVRFFPPGMAMLEIDPSQMGKAWERREELVRLVRKVGFPVVSLDLEGLKRGKMDRFLEVNSSDPD